MRFTKMHGTGNDYIYVNGFVENIKNPSELSLKLSDRHKGVGSDGLVVILPSEDCDFKMRMFNSDGSESEMCGNASRCVGKYVYEKGLTDKTEITLETLAGTKVLRLWLNERKKVEKVTVDMGVPVFDAPSIPATFEQWPVIRYPLPVGEDGIYEVTSLSMGNPHAVLFLEKIDELNLPVIGPIIEHSPFFPNRTNTEFVEVVPGGLKMRVWERGAGETMACGTGACAAVVAAVLNGVADRKTTVQLRGGSLEIEWNEESNRVYLTGDAVTVFEGETELEN
jgi:diaminopimelate epimerase